MDSTNAERNEQPQPTNSPDIEELFYLPQPGIRFAALRELCTACEPEALRSLAVVFLANLDSAFWIAVLPGFITRVGIRQLTRQHLYIPAKIRAMKDEPYPANPPSEEETRRQQEVEKRVQESVDVQLGDQTAIINERTKASLRDLHRAMTPDLNVPQEVLRQSLILCWSSLEVLANDLLKLILNRKPNLFLTMSDDEGCKKLLKVNAIGIGKLATYGFNVSNHLGELIVSEFPIDTIPRMKVVYEALFPHAPAVREALAVRELWMLQQNRNLILHKRGVIDVEYVKNTNTTLLPGDALQLTVMDVKEALRCVEKVGVTLLSTAALILNDGGADVFPGE